MTREVGARIVILCLAWLVPAAGSAQEKFEIAGLVFSIPADWIYEEISGGVLLLAPIEEHDWQANIFVEARVDNARRPPGQAISDLVPNLAARKDGFEETKREDTESPSGIAYGLVEYKHHSQGTRLRDTEVVLVASQVERVFILLSTAESLRRKYQPIFSSFISSINRR